MMDMGLRNCLISNFQSLAVREDKGELWGNAFYRLPIDKYGANTVYN